MFVPDDKAKTVTVNSVLLFNEEVYSFMYTGPCGLKLIAGNCARCAPWMSIKSILSCVKSADFSFVIFIS